MKVCPFCKEEIRDEAIKCRYCSSSLLPPQPVSEPAPAPPSAGSNQVVYVLDQGLIRFGKFAAGVLAIFVAIGIYLYGIDIKESTKEVGISAREVQQSADSINKIKSDVQKAQDEVKGDQTTATKMVADTQTSLGALAKQVSDIQQKQTETSSAAEKAQAAQKRIEAAEHSMEGIQKQSAALLNQANDLAGQILRKKQEVDIAVAHINLYVPGSSPTEEHPAEGSPAPSSSTASSVGEKAASTADHPFTVLELAKLYHFPSSLDGRGQTIGLIELGGGYHDADIDAYFKQLGIPKPHVTSVSVDGGKNAPSEASGADGVVQSNIEIVGGIAPGSHIVAYFAPNTNEGFVDAIQRAVDDKVNRISVLSISWGGPEDTWTPAAIQAMNEALKAAASRNITVFAASGDLGTTDGMTDGKPHVDFPASSPWVTAVAGTHLHASAGEVMQETPWDDQAAGGGGSGRGVSVVFPRPEWQLQAGVPAGPRGFAGRGVPDVAVDASPSTGYKVEVDGQSEVIGGTAPAAPLWAALIALIDQGLGRNVGFINPLLYQKLGPASVLRAVTPANTGGGAGTNAASGQPRWSPVTGWGVPDGEKLLNAFRNAQ